MNIKKLFIITSITLQVSSLMQAFSQDNYNAAFHAFDVKFNSPAANNNTYKQSADFISSHGDAYDTARCTAVANTLGTPEAQAVGIYLAQGTIAATKNSFPNADGLVGKNMSYTNLFAAVAAAPNTLPTPAVSGSTASAGSISSSGSTSSSGSNTPPSLSLKQQKGSELQQAIKSAQETFNLLVPGTYNTNYTLIPAASLPA